jgi:sec-independent protein translocase protein TatA
MSHRSFGIPELLIILAIISLLLGFGRIDNIAEVLGKGIRLFKNGLNDDNPQKGG